MHKTREILRQKWLLGRTHRQTATSNGTSPGAVGSVLARAKAAGLTTWEQVTQLDDEALERALYGTAVVEPGDAPAEPDCAWIHRERHRPHVTLELLHLEYLRQHPNGLRYTAFCNRSRAWLARRGLVMRQVHVAGEKMFVDYAGKKPTLVDPATRAPSCHASTTRSCTRSARRALSFDHGSCHMAMWHVVACHMAHPPVSASQPRRPLDFMKCAARGGKPLAPVSSARSADSGRRSWR